MSSHRRITDPVEVMAQRIAERVVDLVLGVLDVDALLARVDLNALLARVDLNAVPARVDVPALHDLIAGTSVVYSWDARAARLRFLARNSGLAARPASPPAGDAGTAPER